MCLAFPGKVKKVSKGKVLVKYPSEEREALLSGDEIKVGDYVMVQMGVVIKKLTKKEAEESWKAWENSV